MNDLLTDLSKKFSGEIAVMLGVIQDNEEILRVQAAALALQEKMQTTGRHFNFHPEDPKHVTAVQIMDKAIQEGVTPEDLSRWRKWLDDNKRTPEGIPTFMQILAKSGHSGETGRNATLMAQESARMANIANRALSNNPNNQQQWYSLVDKATEERQWITREKDHAVRASQAFTQIAEIMETSLVAQPAAASDAIFNGLQAIKALSSRAMSAAAIQAKEGGLHDASTKLESQIKRLSMGLKPEIAQAPNAELVQHIDTAFVKLLQNMPEHQSKQRQQIANRLELLFDQALGRAVEQQKPHKANQQNDYEVKGTHTAKIAKVSPPNNQHSQRA